MRQPLCLAVCPLLCTLLLAPTILFGQSGAVIPQGGAGHAEKATCVLLKRMGPADEVTSHLYSFGIRGKQFQYIEGKLPDGFPFHGRLTDHDVRNLQARGAEVIVLNQNFTADDLKQARADCRGETGTTPLQSEARSEPKPVESQSSNASAKPAIALPGQLQISSDPAGADIEVDGNYVGNTPSTVSAAAGQHEISIKKPGFNPWQRKITVSAGQINVVAQLEAGSAPVSPASTSPSPTNNAPVASLAKSQSQPIASPPSTASPVLQPAVLKSVEQPAPVSGETTGTVSVTSDPSGADIFVDSVGKGHAPALLKLPAGKHQVQLVLNGYKDWVSDVDVKGGSIVNVTGQLSK